jgi:MFS family permease
MACADGLRAAAVPLLAVLVLTDALKLWELVALVAVYGAGTAFFTPAFEAIIPDLLPAQELPAANALDQVVRPIALRLVGPVVGGGLLAISTGVAFAVDALSFVATLAAVLAIRSRPPAGVSHPSTSAALKEGLHFVAT